MPWLDEEAKVICALDRELDAVNAQNPGNIKEQLQSIWTDIWEHQKVSDLACAPGVSFNGKTTLLQRNLQRHSLKYYRQNGGLVCDVAAQPG